MKLIVFSRNFVSAPVDTSCVTVGSKTNNDNDQLAMEIPNNATDDGFAKCQSERMRKET
jgi:hypothetical protein